MALFASKDRKSGYQKIETLINIQKSKKSRSNIASYFQKIMWNGIFHISDYVCTLKFNIRNHVVSKIANIIVLLEIFEVFSSKDTNIYFINYTNNIDLS